MTQDFCGYNRNPEGRRRGLSASVCSKTCGPGGSYSIHHHSHHIFHHECDSWRTLFQGEGTQ